VYAWFLVGNLRDLRERDHLEDPCLDGEDKIMMDLQEVGWKGGGEGIYWIYLAHDRDRWRAPVNAVMNLGVP